MTNDRCHIKKLCYKHGFSICTDVVFFSSWCIFKIIFVFLLSELFEIKPTKYNKKYV